MESVEPLSVGAVWRGDSSYEAARSGPMWNRRVPERYPDVIVRPGNQDEVIAAVRLARRRGLKIAIRSGGHSWAATFLRTPANIIASSALRWTRRPGETTT